MDDLILTHETQDKTYTTETFHIYTKVAIMRCSDPETLQHLDLYTGPILSFQELEELCYCSIIPPQANTMYLYKFKSNSVPHPVVGAYFWLK